VYCRAEFKAGTWCTRLWTVLMTFVSSNLSHYDEDSKFHITGRASPSVIDSCQLRLHYGNEHGEDERQISQTLTLRSGATEYARGNGTLNVSLAVARQSCDAASCGFRHAAVCSATNARGNDLSVVSIVIFIAPLL
jgi:hypothetical protein